MSASPAVLIACAHELRDLASNQRYNAAECGLILSAATSLDNSGTWQGRYPDEAHRQIHTWVCGLNASSHALLDESRLWDRLANEYDAMAAKAQAAERAQAAAAKHEQAAKHEHGHP